MLVAWLSLRSFYFSLAALAAGFAWHPVFESDPYWHMSLGREVLRQGARVVSEKLAHPSFPKLCVVPEWLWDVLVFGMHAWLGEVGLVVCTMICAALFVLALRALLQREGAAPVSQAAVATLVLATCLWRFEARPEMAALVLLPLFLCLRDRFATCVDERQRVRLTLGLTVLTLLWAQLHGSFVLAPVLIVAAVGTALQARDRAALRAHGLLLVLVLAACLTSAHGFAVANYILAHGGGDATRHITDMMSADLQTLAPFANRAFSSLSLLWTLAVVALLRGRGTSADVLSALLGVALFFDAHRFAGLAAILAARLALAGLTELAPAISRRTDALVGAAAVLALVMAGRSLHDLRGPLLHWQRVQTRHPTLAARWLWSLPAQAPVLTDYVGGAEIGFWLDGHVRTFVDGRTPMYFDDTDLAISRELELSAASFERVRARYGFAAAVVSRHGFACSMLAEIWTPVLVEGLYTTFVPKRLGVKPMPGLEPCGPELLPQLPCAEDGLSQALARLQQLTGESDFSRFIAATREGLCGDPQRGLARLPDAHELWPLRSNLHAVRAHVALRADDSAQAEREIAAVLALEPLMLMRVAAAREFDLLELDQRRVLLEGLIAEMDDASPAWVRGRLAQICAEQADVSCAYFQAIRSAAAGAREALPVLDWLVQSAGDERMRSEALAYRAILSRER